MDFLINIPGPLFLQYFAAASIILFIIYFKIDQGDGGIDEPALPIEALDPYSIAWLRNGTTELLSTVLFSLWKKEWIFYNDKKERVRISRKALKQAIPIQDQVEAAVLNFLHKPRQIAELYEDKELEERLEEAFEPRRQRLIELHLVAEENETTREKWIYCAILFILIPIGCLKMFIGISRDRPVGYLFLLLVADFIVVNILGAIPRRATRRGRKYIKRIQTDLNWMKAASPDILPVALFGLVAFSEFFPLGSMNFLNEATQAANRAHPATGSWGGGGCSTSSDSSSGGCSSGSSCGGGGCGGCGGCGGD